MNAGKYIRYLQHADIDKLKWDQRVMLSANGLLYSHSFYLDSLCHWDALVMGDYECIMPLPVRKKAGFAYIYTPHFTAQLGIIGDAAIDNNLLAAFINVIPRSVRYIDTVLNESNNIEGGHDFLCSTKCNLTLSLQPAYDTIQQGFAKDAKKNIRQSNSLGLCIQDNVDTAIVIDIYRKAYGKLTKATAADFIHVDPLMKTAMTKGKGFSIGVKDRDGVLIAAAFFGIDNKRIYYLLGAPAPAGRKSNAIYFLIDKIIERYAETGLTFDFEGSDIPSVAGFYKKFGPVEKSYTHVIFNRLPLLLRWLKR